MAKLVDITNTGTTVKDKIVYFTIDNVNKRNLLIWLVGGFTITNCYVSEEVCKSEFERLKKIMSED